MSEYCATWPMPKGLCPDPSEPIDQRWIETEAKRRRIHVSVAEGSIHERFREQADKWARETEHLSSPTQMMMHPSYQAILGMAAGHEREIIRLMLLDLRDRRRPWFWALSYLTTENPIKSSDAGKLGKMVQAWVDWGMQRGIL